MTPTPAYHKTTNIPDQLVIVYTEDALKQEAAVMEVMRMVRRAAFFEVQNHLPDMNRESLKRALSNLSRRIIGPNGETKIKKDKERKNMVTNPATGKSCHQYFIP
jgi:hypothetical protein